MKKILILCTCFILFLTVNALSDELIGSSKTSGIFLKDTLSVYAEDDPDFKNVVCYTTNIEIGGPNLENPSNSSIACRLISPFKGTPSNRCNVFSRAKNPFFKKLVVDRFYDKKRNVLIYLSYTKKLKGSNASHSISVVPLNP